MAIQLQLRRGTTAENNTFTGAEGEVTVDTTNDTLRLHDGATLGGFEIDKAENVVHKAGNEVISGTKTLQNTLVLESQTIDMTTSPSGDETFPAIDVKDKNHVTCGYRGLDRSSTNVLKNKVGVHRVINSTDYYAEISVSMDSSGNITTAAPIPGASSSTSDTNIATTGWVNDATKSTNVVHKDTNETVGGTKTFTNSPVLPTPGATDNSTKAATTAYVNSKLVITNSVPSSGTNGVLYFVYS